MIQWFKKMYNREFGCLHVQLYQAPHVDKNWVTKTILRCRKCNKEVRLTNDPGPM